MHKDNRFDDCSQHLDEEADEFARTLLLPLGDVEKRFPRRLTLDSLLEAKLRYRVSFAAFIRSLHDYGFLTTSEYGHAFRRLNQRGWSRIEPGDRTAQESHTHFHFASRVSKRYSNLRDYCEDTLDLSVNLAKQLVPALRVWGLLDSPVDDSLHHQ